MLAHPDIQASGRIDALDAFGLAACSEPALRPDPANSITVFGEMTREVVHDFRNVLCVLTSGLRIIEGSTGDAARLKLVFSGMKEGLARGLEVTERLVEFTRQQDDLAAARRDAEEALEQWADEGGAIAVPPDRDLQS